jgi:hypothetical protein
LPLETAQDRPVQGATGAQLVRTTGVRAWVFGASSARRARLRAIAEEDPPQLRDETLDLAAGVESVLVRSRQYFRPRLLPVVWVVVGIVVAAAQDYFDSLDTTARVLTALAAVLLWPILLFGFDIRISR